MGSSRRGKLTEAMRAALQRPLDAMGLGLRIVAVNLTDVQVPQAVLAAQRELVQAGVERERVAAEAQGYAAELVPAAQGQAQRQRLDAEAYKLQVIGAAEGDAARFDPLAAAYARAPELTRSGCTSRPWSRSWRIRARSSSTARASTTRWCCRSTSSAMRARCAAPA